MSPKTSIALAAAAAAAAALPVTALAAQTATVAATPASLHRDGAHAFQSFSPPLNQPRLYVVFKTHGQLPRRYDGLIRASAGLGSAGGGSIGSVHDKAAHCYLTTVALEDGRFRTRDGSTGARASGGRPAGSPSAPTTPAARRSARAAR